MGLLLLALLVSGAAALGVYIVRSHPALDGELRAPGLTQPVKVSRDAADVTHIEAQSERDAWFGLGYVHAQERGCAGLCAPAHAQALTKPVIARRAATWQPP